MSKKIKVSSNKSFGIVFFVVFVVIGFYPLINQEDFRLWSLIIALIFLGLGLINSSILTPFNLLWFKFGMLLGRVVSPIIMALVFFGVVTPTGLIMKIFKKDLLKLKRKDKKSYWIERKTKSEMKNQF
tara:strand:- start:10 stop:393 length:384 start_codon:yes stop_codon:yes gene_type:complete